MPYFYEFDIDMIVKLRTQYLLHSHGIKSSGFLGLFVVWIKASERHVIGKNVHFGYQLDKNFSMRSPDLLTTGIRKRVSRTAKWELWTHGVDIDLNCLHYPLWRWLK